MDFSGAPYGKTNDLELIVSRLRLGEAVKTSDIVYNPAHPGGIVAAGSLLTNAGSVPSFSWFADPSVLAKPDTGFSLTPATKFRLVPLDGANDVEVTWQMAHDGEVNTKPGVLLRCTERLGTPGGATAAQDGIASAYLAQVRLGGGQLTFFKLLNGVYTALAGSPVTPSQAPAVNQPYWYKVTMVGPVLTFWNSPNGVTWTQQFTVTDADFTNGNTFMTLFNGGMSSVAPYAAHCHFPVLLANRL